MHLLDILICAIVVAGIAVGSARRFSRVLFDGVAFFLALRLTRDVAVYAEGILGLAPAPAALLSFSLLAACFLGVAYILRQATNWDFGMMDPVAGAAVGFFIGLIGAHVLVMILILHANPDGGIPHDISTSTLGREIATFETYHQVMRSLYSIGA